MRRSRASRGTESPREYTPLRREPMTVQGVRDELERATLEYNQYCERNKDEIKRYREDFDSAAQFNDAYERRRWLEELVMGKHRLHITEFTYLYGRMLYWQEMAYVYGVDETIMMAEPNRVAHFWKMFDETEKEHPHHMPTKGQIFDLSRSQSNPITESKRKRSSVIKLNNNPLAK